MIVVADTSPLNYLILINAVEILQVLFEKVAISNSVLIEMGDAAAPEKVRDWAKNAPSWLEVKTASSIDLSINLGAGENEAISLAIELSAAAILIDDKAARNAALERNLTVTGTLGILAEAAERNLLDFSEAAEKLRKTNFRASKKLLDKLIERFNKEITTD
jgi:predicted nucleic acid-binding protein